MLPLNDREQEIIELVCKGKSTTEVAQVIGMSRSTVAGHLRVLYPKLYAKYRAEVCAHFVALQQRK